MTTVDTRPTLPESEAPGRDVSPPPTRRARSSRYRLQVTSIILGSVALVFTALYGVQVGTSGASFGHVVGALWAKVTSTAPADQQTQTLYAIIWELRMPRIGLALIGGAALAVSGVIFQGLLRNPLVSPFTLGIAPAAAFGASVAVIVFGATSGGSAALLVAGALTAALLSTVLVLALASVKRLEPTTLILVGIALTQLFAALTAGIQYFAEDEVLASIIRWTWGSVNNAVWYQVVVLGVVVAIAYPYVQWRSSALNAIAFAGDDAAKSLGVPVGSVRLQLIAIAAILTGLTIAFTGIIGFVGLVAPHIARLIIGGNHRFLLPFSAVIGALILVVADVVGRVVLAPAVVPVGIIDALIGAPIFIYLILTRRKALA